MKGLPIISLILLAGAGFNASALETYDVPRAMLYQNHNDDFTVRVREPGQPWQDLYEYNVQVDLDNPQNASMVNFTMDKPVELAVTKNNGQVNSVDIRPLSKQVRSEIKGKTAYFTISKPQYLSIEFNGDRLHNLHIFADKTYSQPKTGQQKLMVFEAGLHKPEGKGYFDFPSNTLVYLHGGAVLQGKVLINRAENVQIIGPGIINNPERGFEITNSKNVTIDGPIVRNPDHYTVFCGQSSQINISSLKSFSAKPWTDGIDMMSCSDVTIDDVFLRTSDDAIAIYGHRWDYYGDSKNISVTNSTLWVDVAHPINIGLHGNPNSPETVENVHFKNIDILGHDEDDRNYQGVMAISNSDDILVQNIRFEDFRIEDVQEGMLFNFRTLFNDKYSHKPGRGIRNVTVRNIEFIGDKIGLNPSVIEGYSTTQNVQDIVIENVTVAGKKLSVKDIQLGQFVEHLTVR